MYHIIPELMGLCKKAFPEKTEKEIRDTIQQEINNRMRINGKNKIFVPSELIQQNIYNEIKKKIYKKLSEYKKSLKPFEINEVEF